MYKIYFFLFLLLMSRSFVASAQKKRIGLVSGYNIYFDTDLAKVTGGNYTVYSQVHTESGATGGIKIRRQIKPDLYWDTQLRVLYNYTQYEVDTQVPEVVEVKMKWEFKSYAVVVPLGLAKAIHLNENTCIQGLLHEYVGAEVKPIGDMNNELVVSTRSKYSSLSGQFNTTYNGNVRFVFGAQAGIGLWLPKRGIEVNVFYTRPQTLNQLRVKAPLSYTDIDGNSGELPLQGKVASRTDNLSAQLVIYWK